MKEILFVPHQNEIIDDIYREMPRDNFKAMSVDDWHFIHIMTQGAHTNSEGNFEFPLPFKEGWTNRPNENMHILGERSEIPSLHSCVYSFPTSGLWQTKFRSWERTSTSFSLGETVRTLQNRRILKWAERNTMGTMHRPWMGRLWPGLHERGRR